MNHVNEEISFRQAIEAMQLPAIISFGNPLLDITITLDNDDLLKKYDLQADGEKEMSAEEIHQLMDELPAESSRTVSAGGSAQNTMRIMQWLCGARDSPRLGIYCGGLGKDPQGRILENMVRATGVDTRYAIRSELPTGVCISMIHNHCRSLVAHIGAASAYSLSDLEKQNLPWDSVKIIYIEGFFITHSLDVALSLGKLARERGIVLAFNISGEYLFQDYQAAICEMVGLAGIVFSNSREMIALARVLNLHYNRVEEIPFLLNNLRRITVDASNKNPDNWLSQEGIVVMTQGKSPAFVIWGDSESAQVKPSVIESLIVDTTGAGDSLVAGFLLGALFNWSPKRCLEFGCKVAAEIITRVGVTLPDTVPPQLFMQ